MRHPTRLCVDGSSWVYCAHNFFHRAWQRLLMLPTIYIPSPSSKKNHKNNCSLAIDTCQDFDCDNEGIICPCGSWTPVNRECLCRRSWLFERKSTYLWFYISFWCDASNFIVTFKYFYVHCITINFYFHFHSLKSRRLGPETCTLTTRAPPAPDPAAPRQNTATTASILTTVSVESSEVEHTSHPAGWTKMVPPCLGCPRRNTWRGRQSSSNPISILIITVTWKFGLATRVLIALKRILRGTI